jgi:hypothetical protein
VYLVADGLAKLRAPAAEAAPLLLAALAHLSAGLALRPTKPVLHVHLCSTPPSVLLKLATAVRVRRWAVANSQRTTFRCSAEKHALDWVTCQSCI